MILNNHINAIISVYNDQKININPKRKKRKEYHYYKNYEAKRRESGKGTRIKHKVVRRIVKILSKRARNTTTLRCT